MKKLLLISMLTLGLQTLAAAQEDVPEAAEVTTESADSMLSTDSAALPDAEPEAVTEATEPTESTDSILAPDAVEAAAAAVATETISVSDLAPPEAVSVPAVSDSPQQLDEIVVTAQKTKQTLRRVPVSVTAVDGEFIKDTGSASLADISLYVPNVRIDADDLGSPQVFIRGFGTNAFNPSFESSVGLVQDEIYFGRPGYFTESMFDIDRVEVLRGPQGTLFGKNTVAGVFNVISKGPEPDVDFTADGRYFYGENNEHRLEGGAGGMFNDWGGARIAGLYLTKEGQLHNQFLDRNEDKLTQKAARVKMRFFSSAGFDTEITAAKSDTEAPFWPFQLFKLDDDTRTYLSGFDPNIEDDPYNFITSFDTRGYIEKGSDTLSAKTQWNVGEFAGLQDFTPVLVVGASKFFIDQLNELDVSPADIARLDSHERHKQFSAELRFTGSADSLFGLGTGVEFVSGLFFYKSTYDLLARILAGRDLGSFLLTRDFCQLSPLNATGACPLVGAATLPGVPVLGSVTALATNNDAYQFDYLQDISSLAFFGQLTWNLTEKFAVTPGVRLSQEKKRVDSAGNAQCTGRDLTGRPCVMEQLLMTSDYDERDRRRDEFDVSPKLALQYFAEHDVNYYASYARGFKSGGFNSISFNGEDLEYEPEEARTVEVGAKGKFLDRTLGVNITLYDTRFDNLQVLAFNGVFFDVSNAASAQSRGLEADFTWLTPYEPLRLMGSIGVLNAKYLDYTTAPAPISQGINQLQDLSGKRIAFSPSSTATLTPMLTYPLGEMLGSFAVDVIYQGDQFTDTDLDPNTYVAAYTKYAARFILASASGVWSFAIGGSNLTDERVLNQVIDATFFPGSYFAQQSSGRQLFATVSFKI